MRPSRRHLAALAAGAALLPVGCGSSDEPPKGKPLPQAAVTDLTKRLDEVQRRFDAGTKEGNAGACEDIESDSFEKGIDSTVAGLPDDVDDDVRTALEKSLTRLRELTRDGCSGVEETPTEQEPPPPDPVPQQPIPQETVPDQTEEEPGKDERPKEEKKPKDNGNGNGNGEQPGDPVVPPEEGGGQPAPRPGEG